MKTEIINSDGLFASITRNHMISVDAVLKLIQSKDTLGLNEQESELFDKIMQCIQNLPIQKSVNMPVQPSKTDPNKSWVNFYNTSAYFWIGVDKFHGTRNSFETQNARMDLWEGVQFISKHSKLLRKWAESCDHSLGQHAFRGAKKLRDESKEWIIRNEDPLEKLAFGEAYAVFQAHEYQHINQKVSGYLNAQTCLGSLANARFFESEKAIEMASKKNSRWGNGFIVKVKLEVDGLVNDNLNQRLGDFAEVLPLIERKRLSEKLNSAAEHEKKLALLIERVREVNPELLVEVGLETPVKAPRKRM